MITITLTQPGQSPVDVTEHADLRSMQIGGKAANGERTTMSIRFYDTIANVVSFTALYILKVTEDATTPDTTLASGRCTGWQLARGAGRRADGDIFQTGNFEDANRETIGLGFAPSEGGADANGVWSRPEETDVERVLALASDFLNGSPRPETVIDTTNYVYNTNTVTMPAKDYPAGTEPLEVLNDCASTAGKIWWVDADYELHYQLRGATDYMASLSITDRENEVNWTTHFPPEWLQGDAIDYRGEQVAHGIVATWGIGNAVFYEDAAAEAQFGYHVASINVPEAETAAQALAKATATVNARKRGARTYFVSLLLDDTQVDLVKVGQQVPLKARATDLPNAFDNRLIAELKWEYLGYRKYYAHLFLDYPTRLIPAEPPVGPKPPRPGSGDAPTVVDSGVNPGGNDNSIGASITVGSATDDALVAFAFGQNLATEVRYVKDTGFPDTFQSFTKLDELDVNGNARMSVWVLLNPEQTVTASDVRVSFSGSLANSMGVFYLTGVNQSDPQGSPAFNNAAGLTSSVEVVAGANQLVLNMAGWISTTLSGSEPTPVSGQTEAWSERFNNSPGRADLAHGGGYGDATPSWTFDTLKPWLAAAIAINGTGEVGDTTEPVGDDGEGTAGTDNGTYAPIDHVHEHGDLSADDEHHHDASNTQYDSRTDGIAAAENVDAALFALEPTTHTAAPTVDDDTLADYIVGSRWLDTTNDKEYVALDVSEGAAVWVETTAGAASHASSHEDGGADEVAVEDLPTAETSTTVFLRPDGTGGVEFATPPSAGGLTIEDADASPQISATTLVFENGTLVDEGSGVASYTAPSGGSASFAGKVPFVVPEGYDATVAATTETLAAAGGAFAVPMYLSGPMDLQGYTIRNSNTSLQRTAEARLYIDNGDSTADFVTGTDAAWDFTPGAASFQHAAVSGAPVALDAGTYWLVFRNTHASNNFIITRMSPQAHNIIRTAMLLDDLGSSLGASLELVSGWTVQTGAPAIAIVGRVLGQTTAYFTT